MVDGYRNVLMSKVYWCNKMWVDEDGGWECIGLVLGGKVRCDCEIK